LASSAEAYAVFGVPSALQCSRVPPESPPGGRAVRFLPLRALATDYPVEAERRSSRKAAASSSVMATASPTGPFRAIPRPARGRGHRTPCPVGHHLSVPIDPLGEFDPYGGESPPDSLVGQLLVATPAVDDPNFRRRVILVLDHGLEGALGVVVDRPGGVAVDRLFPRWHPVATPPGELFTGGPMARNSIIGLVRLASRAHGVEGAAARPTGWRLLVDGDSPVGTVDLGADPSASLPAITGARLFSGYAGWVSGQLEDEIQEGSWYVVRCEARDPISADPEGLWRRVLRRQGGALALVSGFPADPTSN